MVSSSKSTLPITSDSEDGNIYEVEKYERGVVAHDYMKILSPITRFLVSQITVVDAPIKVEKPVKSKSAKKVEGVATVQDPSNDVRHLIVCCNPSVFDTRKVSFTLKQLVSSLESISFDYSNSFII